MIIIKTELKLLFYSLFSEYWTMGKDSKKDKKSEKSEKSSKHSKHGKSDRDDKDEKREKKHHSNSNDKHEKNEKNTDIDINKQISSDDFFLKNEEFRVWLRLEKNK